MVNKKAAYLQLGIAMLCILAANALAVRGVHLDSTIRVVLWTTVSGFFLFVLGSIVGYVVARRRTLRENFGAEVDRWGVAPWFVAGLRLDHNDHHLVIIRDIPESPGIVGIVLADILRNYRDAYASEGVDGPAAATEMYRVFVAEMANPTDTIEHPDDPEALSGAERPRGHPS